MNQEALAYASSLQEKFDAIILPLSYLNIPYFIYTKIFADSKYVMLSNHTEWLTYHMQNIQDQGIFFDQQNQLTEKCKINIFYWPTKPADSFLEALYKFNIWNGISFIKRSEGYIERFCFAADINNYHINSFYINNINLLKRFIRYFLTEIDTINKDYNESQLAIFANQISIEQSNAINPAKIISLSINNDFPVFLTKNCNKKLSRREVECLRYLYEGKTSKDIAVTTNLSVRTIEYYLNNIKEKTGIYQRSKLIDAYKRFALLS